MFLAVSLGCILTLGTLSITPPKEPPETRLGWLCQLVNDTYNFGQGNHDRPEYYEVVGLSEEDFELFAAIVRAEDGADSFDNRVAVACVILNRIESGQFNDTVRTVIEEQGQFSTSDHNGGAIDINGNTVYADESSRRAVVYAFLNRPIPEDVLYFREGYFFEGLTPYEKIGDNCFSYG